MPISIPLVANLHFPPFETATWHALSTWGLVGLIWVVQLAIYPLYSKVGTTQFPAYHQAYCSRIVWMVAPLMLVELLAAVALLYTSGSNFGRAESIGGLLAIGAIWLATAFLSVPAHKRLTQGFDEKAWRKLVRSNWIRTVLWTARGVWVAFAMDRP